MKASKIFRNNTVKALQQTPNLIDLLQNEDRLRSFLDSFSINGSGLLGTKQISHLISKYSKAYNDVLSSFINNKIMLYEVAISFLHFIKETKAYENILQLKNSNEYLILDRTTFKINATFHNLNDFLFAKLSKISSNPNIKVFGFGLGNGAYEKKLARFLIDTKKIATFELYGYDPYAIDKSSYISLTAQEMASYQKADFDLIVARWCLHHIKLNERWDKFSSCLKMLKPGGNAIIIEHGYIGNNDDLGNEKLYLILNAMIDVMGNLIFNTEWVLKANSEDNYFLEFLKEDDIKFMINQSNINLSMQVDSPNPLFPYDSVISLQHCSTGVPPVKHAL